jgi:hypothetical protein
MATRLHHKIKHKAATGVIQMSGSNVAAKLDTHCC